MQRRECRTAAPPRTIRGRAGALATPSRVVGGRAGLACLAWALLLSGCGHSELERHQVPDSASELVDWADVLQYVERAVMAYRDDELIRGRYPGVELTTLHDERVKVLFDVDEASGRQWVAIRGTANWTNAFEDLEYVKTAESHLGIRVHSGFHAASDAALDWLLPRLHRDLPVRLTGHSLGGAIAVLLEARLIVEGYSVEGCVTLGQPKVTNEEGARKLRSYPLLRLLTEDDVVPMVPPVTLVTSWHGPYRHFGPEVILPEDGGFVYLAAHDAERFQVTSAWEHLVHLSVSAHSSENYLARTRWLAGR